MRKLLSRTSMSIMGGMHLTTSYTDSTVCLQEVGPRDGLQNETRCLAVDERSHLIESLAGAGLQRIQIGSFVNPRKVPQMANTDLVWKRLAKSPKVRYSVLALNRRGLELALSHGIPHVEIYASASETHSLKNAGATVQEAVAQALASIGVALSNGIGVTAGIMCAFGCFFEGRVPFERVRDIVVRFLELGPVEIALADTAGMGKPDQMKRMIEYLGEAVGVDRLTLHLHDTRGFGLANLLAAVQMGVRRFDTSVGGLGGCPFIPGAAGNISTEASVERLHSLGLRTGVDPDRLSRVKRELEQLLGKALIQGHVVNDEGGGA